MGSLKRKSPPRAFRRYKWLKSSESATILGVPLGGPGALKAFWRRLADKIDKKAVMVHQSVS
eukprot:scaffold132237_cov26-Tisochrysis_lutea.AAC.1